VQSALKVAMRHALCAMLNMETIMFKNYLKIAIRNIVKHKLNSTLNIAGLSLGIACSLLIIFHVKEELSYEKGFPKADKIYRITSKMREGNNFRHWAVTSPPLALLIRDHIPEITQTARFRDAYSQILTYHPRDGEPVSFEEEGGYFADQAAIDMFDLHFVE
jgi:putative ABC transport system permease protein